MKGPAVDGAPSGIGWNDFSHTELGMTFEVTQERLAVGLRVTDDRVLIKADREEQAPTQTGGGLYVAKSLAAAVDGSDEQESWFVGTIVQVGPGVNRFEVKPVVLDWLQELIDEYEYGAVATVELRMLKTKIDALPAEHLDQLKVGNRVVFSWAAGQQITIDGERYLILRESEVLAVLEGECGS